VDKSKINILYVITKLELGGAQKQLLSLICRLDKDRYKVFLFTAKKGLLFEDALAIQGLEVKPALFLERPLNLIKDLLAFIELYFFIRKNSIDIVHTHSSKAGILGRLAAKLARVKTIIHTVHGWSFNDFQPAFTKRIFILLERICARVSDKIIVVSGWDLRAGLANAIGIPGKYELIHYGIDDQDFRTSNKGLREELGIASDELVVGSIACLKPQKSPLDFIRLASLVNQACPGTKFIMAGDGVLRRKSEALISKLKLEKQVILLGWRRDVPKFLHSIDIFVLTSLWEGMPISVLEAMAAGLPLVVTDTGGVREIISHGNTGFLVTPHNLSAMAEKTTALLKDPRQRELTGRNARDSLGGAFDVEKMASATSFLYEDLRRSLNPGSPTIPALPREEKK
jgi:glycosyltransferase involved in cell wall biosynthesis